MSLRKLTHTSQKKDTVVRIAAGGIILAAALAFAVFLLYRYNCSTPPSPILQEDDGKKAADLQRLSEETYSAVLLSMHSTANYREEDFLRYRGLDTLVAAHALLNTEELAEYLDCILRSGNAVSDLYLCPDPKLLWEASGQKTGIWEKNLKQDLYSHIKAHPDITFSVLLPHPYIGYWLDLDEESLDMVFSLYRTLINGLSAYPNARTFFPGAQDWLTINPDNYADTFFDTNEVITESMLLHVFCDGDYAITPENEDNFWTSLRETIARERLSPTRHTDLSGWCLVFFGDSILGNYPGSFSIPGYVTGLSDAVSFNYAVSGTSASSIANVDRPDFPTIVYDFLEKNTTLSGNVYRFTPEGSPASGLADKKLCFLISYGFNDYFDGAPVENPQDPYDIHSFKGGLRTCIARLQEAFPHAAYVLMTPTHTSAFQSGTESNNENGDRFPDYINAVREIAGETGAFLLDNYNDFIITEENLDEYLADGIHPNETGRLAIACRIIDFIEKEMR